MRQFSWHSLRSHFDSLHASFEQLCASLFAKEAAFRDQHCAFVRNGTPDGGVECYWREGNGTVHALQAKFHLGALGKSQFKKLDESMHRAVRQYPTMQSIVIAIPLNLPDARSSRARSARERWEAWRLEWLERARTHCPLQRIVLWDQHAITERLAEPHNAGALRFFFDGSILHPPDMLRRLKEQVALAASKYHPELHVRHPLEPLLEWVACTQAHRTRQHNELARSCRHLGSEGVDASVLHDAQIAEMWTALVASGKDLLASIDAMPATGYADAISAFGVATNDMLSALYSHNPLAWHVRSTSHHLQSSNRAKKWAALSPFWEAASALSEAFDGVEGLEHARHSECSALLIHGEGGCGKTHLLCQIASEYARSGVPVVLRFGFQIRVQSFWQDVLAGVHGFTDHHELLAAMDVAAEANGTRALIIVDAINDAEGNSRWSEQLQVIITAITEYPRVRLILSVREEYLRWVLPSANPIAPLAVVRHSGFSEVFAKAIERYCRHFNIIAPSVPPMSPELENPLILSMLCSTTAGSPDPDCTRPPVSFAGGALSLTTIFDAFLADRDRELCKLHNLDRDHHDRPLVAACHELARVLGADPHLETTVERCKRILDRYLRAPSPIPNIITYLEAAQVLCRLPRWDELGEATEHVQFAFDRMTSHFVTRELLRGCSSASDAVSLLSGQGRLASLFANSQSRAHARQASLAEALCTQWPERFGADLFDSVPEAIRSPLFVDAFLSSLSLASVDAFQANTGAWLAKCLDSLPSNSDERATRIVNLLSRVSHAPLVQSLHAYLERHSLGDRDAWWTTGISPRADSLGVSALLEWPLQSRGMPLDLDLRLSTATSIAWLTTSTSPMFRKQCMKAIAAACDADLDVGQALLARFARVNDPYVLESCAVAVYGAALRSTDAARCRSLAERVIALWPTKRRWPVHVNTRHALAGIVEYAASLDPGWKIDLTRVQPPYQSAWPTGVPTWASLIAKRKRAADRKHIGFPSVMRSCMPEHVTHEGKPGWGSYGDFGRYTVSAKCGSFFRDTRVGHNPPRLPFALDLPHRFIIQRVLSLGWTPKRFERFDRSHGSTDRFNNSCERIGKKYQWIALHEFLARAADRHPRLPDAREGTFASYVGPWSVGCSLPTDASTDTLSVPSHSACNWLRQDPAESLWAIASTTRWLLSKRDFPEPRELLLQSVGDANAAASMLCGFMYWRGKRDSKRDAGVGNPERRLWLHVHSYAIRLGDAARWQQWLSRAGESRGIRLPDPDDMYDPLFGELYWSRAAKSAYENSGKAESPWESPDQYDPWPCPLLPLAVRYARGYEPGPNGGHVSRLLPSRWLAEQLRVRATPEFRFTNGAGRTVAWNAGCHERPDCDAAFCDAGALRAVLQERELMQVWFVLGEKNQMHDWDHDGPQWPTLIGAYWQEGAGVGGNSRIELDTGYPARRSSPIAPGTLGGPFGSTPEQIAATLARHGITVNPSDIPSDSSVHGKGDQLGHSSRDRTMRPAKAVRSRRRRKP